MSEPWRRRLVVFFLLGVAAQLPWSASALVLPWLIRAAAVQPLPPQSLLLGLPSLLQGMLSLGNVIMVLSLAHSRAVERLRPAFTIVLPLLVCTALIACTSAAASRSTGAGAPLSGKAIVGAALPCSLLLGASASLAACGCANLASDRAAMQSYVMGQGVAQVISALLSLAAAAVTTHEALSGRAADRAQARHAEETLLSSAVVLLGCCFAFAALPRAMGREMRQQSKSASGGEARQPPRAPLPPEDPLGEEELEAVDPRMAAMAAAVVWTVPNEPAEDAEDNYLLLLDGPPEAQAPERASTCSQLLMYKLSLFCTAAITLSVYPGITSFLRPAHPPSVHLPGLPPLNGALLVPSTFAIYAVAELLGRLAAAAGALQAHHLLTLALCRIALLPAILMLNVAPPSGRWHAPRLLAHSDVPPIVTLVLLACSNGYITAQGLAACPKADGAGEPAKGGATTALLAWLVAGVMTGSVVGMVLALALQA